MYNPYRLSLRETQIKAVDLQNGDLKKMKVCATQLMKELKALQGEIYDIYQDDDKSSVVPADQKTLEPKYTVEYDYEKNRKNRC